MVKYMSTTTYETLLGEDLTEKFEDSSIKNLIHKCDEFYVWAQNPEPSYFGLHVPTTKIWILDTLQNYLDWSVENLNNPDLSSNDYIEMGCSIIVEYYDYGLLGFTLSTDNQKF
jgi:hypothetical protein